jgi:hypothetical protein
MITNSVILTPVSSVGRWSSVSILNDTFLGIAANTALASVVHCVTSAMQRVNSILSTAASVAQRAVCTPYPVACNAVNKAANVASLQSSQQNTASTPSQRQQTVYD